MNDDMVHLLVRKAAQEILEYLLEPTSDTHSTYTLRPDAPAWVHDFVCQIFKEVEEDEFPPLDTWSFVALNTVLEAIVDADDLEEGYADLEPDIYWDNLMEWLSANPDSRSAFVEDAIRSTLDRSGAVDIHFFEILYKAQAYELEKLYTVALDVLTSRAEDLLATLADANTALEPSASE